MRRAVRTRRRSAKTLHRCLWRLVRRRWTAGQHARFRRRVRFRSATVTIRGDAAPVSRRRAKPPLQLRHNRTRNCTRPSTAAPRTGLSENDPSTSARLWHYTKVKKNPSLPKTRRVRSEPTMSRVIRSILTRVRPQVRSELAGSDASPKRSSPRQTPTIAPVKEA